jgi:exodeoxyribonuclease-3
MILATWNVNSLNARIDHLVRWLGEAKPDVVCLQETKLTDDQFPASILADAGYPHQIFSGQPTYNGVAILSKHPMEDASCGFHVGEPDPQPRMARATIGGIRIFGLYVPNGQAVGSPKFSYKLDWLRRLRIELDADGPNDRPMLVCGDFNVSLRDLDVWDPFEAEGEVMYSQVERDAVADVVAYGLVDLFRKHKPEAREYTWWDYRMLGFQKNHGFRIDHVFGTAALASCTTDATIHRATRKWPQPSDHVPVTISVE